MTAPLTGFAQAVARSAWALSLLAVRRADELVRRGRLADNAASPFEEAAGAAERQLPERWRPFYRAGRRASDSMIETAVCGGAGTPFDLARIARSVAAASGRFADTVDRTCRPRGPRRPRR